MFELLLRSGKASEQYPYSGPGSKNLMGGDTEYGYFGELKHAGMGVNDQLISLLRGYSFTPKSDLATTTWRKFYYKGKVLFYPEAGLGNATYLDLQSCRLVFDATLAPPNVPDTLPWTTTPMYSANPIIVGSDGTKFRVRNIEAYAAGYATNASSIPVGVGTEAYDLISRLYQNDLTNPFGVKFNANIWATATGYLTQEISRIANNDAAGIFQSTVFSLGLVSNISTTTRWLPVLEVIPPDSNSLFPPYNLQYTTDITEDSVTPNTSASVVYPPSETSLRDEPGQTFATVQSMLTPIYDVHVVETVPSTSYARVSAIS